MKSIDNSAESDTDFSRMTLDEAFLAHRRWKLRLKQAIETGDKLDINRIQRDDSCSLGAWLHAEGAARYGHLPQFAALLEKHREFHAVAADVVAAIDGKQFELGKSLQAEGSPFALASLEVSIAIQALREVVA